MFKKDEEKLSFYDTAKKNGMIFPELENYYNKMNIEKSTCSIRSYKESISRFQINFNIYSIEDMEKIKKNDLINYQDNLRQSGLKYTSVNAHFLRIKAFWGNLIYRELINNEVITKIKTLKKGANDEVKSEIFTLTDAEVATMINSCKDIQEKLMITFMFETGARRSEITKILINDIQDGKVLLKGKGNKPVKISLKPFVLEMLEQAMQERKSNCEYLFYAKGHKGQLTGEAVFDRFINAMRDAGISEDKISLAGAHTSRRTAISRWAKEYGLLVARDMARHSDAKTTQIYTKVNQEDIDNAFLGIKNKENKE